jgi:hypothetical protein
MSHGQEVARTFVAESERAREVFRPAREERCQRRKQTPSPPQARLCCGTAASQADLTAEARGPHVPDPSLVGLSSPQIAISSQPGACRGTLHAARASERP